MQHIGTPVKASGYYIGMNRMEKHLESHFQQKGGSSYSFRWHEDGQWDCLIWFDTNAEAVKFVRDYHGTSWEGTNVSIRPCKELRKYIERHKGTSAFVVDKAD